MSPFFSGMVCFLARTDKHFAFFLKKKYLKFEFSESKCYLKKYAYIRIKIVPFGNFYVQKFI